jgi:hypothetical protein
MMSVITMSQFKHSPFEGSLDIVATLRDSAIQASLAELRERDRLTIALRQMLRQGVRIEDLSDASGLTVAEIRRRVDGELALTEDIDALAGLY